MKGKNLQPRILYPAKLSFRFDGEIKSFPDKHKLREFSTTKSALEQMLKVIKKDFPTTRITSGKPNCNSDGCARSETITKAGSTGSIRGVWIVNS